MEDININSIVSKNFFKYLKEKNISQGQYAKLHNLDPATISNWKSGKTSMSAEQILEAASFFGVTPNDLYYEGNDRKKLEVLTDNNYHPIMAQQNVNVKYYKDDFSKPFEKIGQYLYIMSVFILAAVICVGFSIYWSLLVFGGLLGLYELFTEKFGIKKSFVINYLDDIFYYMKDNKNHNFRKMILMHIIIAGLNSIVLVFCMLFYGFVDIDEILFIIVTIVMLISFVFNIVSFKGIPRRYMKKMYDKELTVYYYSFATLTSNILAFGFVAVLVRMAFKELWFMGVLMIIAVGIALYEYKLCCNNFSKYRLVYEKNGESIEELFK